MRRWYYLAVIAVMICLIMVGCGEVETTMPTTVQKQDVENTTIAPLHTTVATQPTTQITQPTTQPVTTTQPTEPAPPETTHPLECEYVEAEIITEGSCVDWKEVRYECVYCGDQYVARVLSGIGHDFAEEVMTKEAACGVDGEIWLCCTMCDQKAFYKEIPRTGEHDLVLVENEKNSQYFAGIRSYKCNNCDKIVYEYYGEYGVYDMDAIKKAVTEYIRQYGFNIVIAESSDDLKNGKFYYHDFYLCEIMGAHDYLYDKVFESVERWCQNRLEQCQANGVDPRLFTCTVYLGYTQSGSAGGSSFVVWVTPG